MQIQIVLLLQAKHRFCILFQILPLVRTCRNLFTCARQKKVQQLNSFFSNQYTLVNNHSIFYLSFIITFYIDGLTYLSCQWQQVPVTVLVEQILLRMRQIN